MIDQIKRPALACLSCAGALVLLTALAYEVEPFGRLDAGVLSRLSAYKETSIGRVADFFVHLADPLPQIALIVLACGMALMRRRTRLAVGAAVLVGGANLTTQVLKELLAHQRYQPVLGFYQIGRTSFPSGHATAAMAISLAFLLVTPRGWRPTVVALGASFVLAVGFAVVIVHHHYPSDVVGGWLVAIGWCFAVIAGLRASSLLISDRQAQLAD